MARYCLLLDFIRDSGISSKIHDGFSSSALCVASFPVSVTSSHSDKDDFPLVEGLLACIKHATLHSCLLRNKVSKCVCSFFVENSQVQIRHNSYSLRIGHKGSFRASYWGFTFLLSLVIVTEPTVRLLTARKTRTSNNLPQNALSVTKTLIRTWSLANKPQLAVLEHARSLRTFLTKQGRGAHKLPVADFIGLAKSSMAV